MFGKSMERHEGLKSTVQLDKMVCFYSTVIYIYMCVCDNLTKPQSLVPFVCYMYVVGLERSTNVTFKTSFDSDTKALLLLVPAIIIKRNEW